MIVLTIKNLLISSKNKTESDELELINKEFKLVMKSLSTLLGNKKKQSRSYLLKKMRSTALRVLRYVSEFEIEIIAPLSKATE